MECISNENAAPWRSPIPESIEPDRVIDAVDAALSQVDAMGISDLHLEPRPNGYQVRLRKDGLFLEGGHREPGVVGRVIARLKVMARLAVHRTDIPQEGGLELPGGRGHGRISIVPTVNGEKAVLRLLERGPHAQGLEGLGFDPAIADPLRALIASPQGLVLVTGPSGAGKTTTLYALLEEIRRTQGSWRSLTTLEDPVERNLGSIPQTEVSPDRGLTFPAGLRALLRQDPEVLMVGEIRDPETARIAVQASLTGHLVLSSLHTSSCFEALARLRDLGVDTGLAAGALRGILSQRLVPRACACGSSFTAQASGGAGACGRCRGTGLSGRVAVAELLVLDEPMRELVRGGADTQRLESVARSAGFVPLAARVRQLIDSGVTRAELAWCTLEGGRS